MPSLTRNEYDVLVVALSWIVGFLPLLAFRRRLTWIQCVGLALVATPLVRMLLNIYLSIDALLVFTVLEPAPRDALWRSVGRDLVFDLTIPLVGILLAHNAIPGIASRRAPRMRPIEGLTAEGLGPKAGYARDALRGSTLFFCIAAAYLAALGISRLFTPEQAGGDESRYWQNITVPLIVLVSGMAGLTEEILFRGVLLTRLARAMPVVVAALLQALFFGFIHAGYGTWTHILGPFAFGLGMAWVARTLGIVPAILLHVQVNVVFFALDVADVVPEAWWLLATLALFNLYAAFATRLDAVIILWSSLATAVRRVVQRPRGPEDPRA